MSWRSLLLPRRRPPGRARARIGCVALALTCLLAPTLALADDPPAAGADAPSSNKAASEALETQGREAYAAGRFQEAYRAFESAFGQDPRPKLLYNMARCLEKLAKYTEAIEILQRYLSVHRQQTGQDPDNKAEVEVLIRTFRERAFDALPEVTIASSPPGATVRLQPSGAVLGNTPLTTHLKPGIYKLRLELDKHTPLENDLVVPETGKVRVVLALKSTVRLAALSFWCNIRQVKIAVDGKVVAVTPFSGRIDVAPGRHQVSLSREGYSPMEEIVDVPEDKELQLGYHLDPLASQSTWRSWLGWPVLVAGAGGIGGGVASGVQAEQYYRGSPDFETWASWQKIGYGAGGAALGVGLALVIWDAVRDNIPEADLVPGPKHDKGSKLVPLGPSGAQEQP